MIFHDFPSFPHHFPIIYQEFPCENRNRIWDAPAELRQLQIAELVLHLICDRKAVFKSPF
jgi:hypothetical protein